ncbi:hypothetical protein [Granulicella sibirica]|uniref:hypothetical protein n=1 Tax=Granulicella sibirica TaxID=2479048 RepID=UPI001F4F75C8|nr:hypothetical protein [Granulicella sibirica]
MISSLNARRTDRYASLIIAFLIFCSAAISVGMVWAPTHQERLQSIFDLGYFVGPTTQSLLQDHGLLVCFDQLRGPTDALCFHSARMPVASIVLATGVKLFGDDPKRIDVAKTLVFLIPLWISFFFILRFVSKDRKAATLCGLILFLPLLASSLLVVITSMEVEEGYLYGLLTLALVLIVFPFRRSTMWAVCSAVILELIFLSKSSMLPAVAVLLLATLFHLRSWRLRMVITLLVALAPLSWAAYQHHVSGRYSVGTSLDGFNFHKGNNPDFLDRYPTTNARFDSFDPALNGNRYFPNEWAFNDYHLSAGRAFALSRPTYTLIGLWRKFSYLFFSLNSFTATRMSRIPALLTLAGVLTFRLILWSAVALSLFALVTKAGQLRSAALTYLLLLSAYSLPYLVGFGFMRHAVVLAYPSAVFCTFYVYVVRAGANGYRLSSLAS